MLMYKLIKEKRNPIRVKRLIENIPVQIAEELYELFIQYKNSKIDLSKFKDLLNARIMTEIKTTCNSIDSSSGRPINQHRINCVLENT